MEYKTIDDRSVNTDNNTKNENEDTNEIIDGFNTKILKERYPDQAEKINQFKESLLSELENSVIDIWEIQNLGFQTVQTISQSSDPWEKLKDISWNLPVYLIYLELSQFIIKSKN